MGLSMVLLHGAPIAIFLTPSSVERIDERGRRRGGGPARRILHALDQLAVVALALGERGRGRREHDDIDLGVGELAALRFQLEHAAVLLLRRDVAIGDAPGVQRDRRRQRRRELRLLGRVGRRRQQAEAMGLLDVRHPAHCDPSRPAALMTGWNFSDLRLDVARELLGRLAAHRLRALAAISRP